MNDPEAQQALLRNAVGRTGDESPPERLLLLWFLRHVMVVDRLDAYEHVVDDPGSEIDGLLIERSWDADDPAILHVFEARFPRVPTPLTGREITRFADATSALTTEGLSSQKSLELQRIGLREDIDQRLSAGEVIVRPTLIAAAPLDQSAKDLAVDRGVRVYDLDWLAHLAAALEGPGLKEAKVVVRCTADRRFVTATDEGRLAVCEVEARQIAEWPGIDDRSLFGLNVRGELPQNRVRTELDAALREKEEHGNFVAYHNGLTVVCERFEARPDDVVIRNLSVVNGAQSVLAFRRNAQRMGSSLRVLVKLVETSAADFATEVARRSNTQTAVNPRNLRANDGRQQRLREEFERQYPAYSYVVKQEATRRPPGEPINNDDAAQLLSALYNERPWLAVKRQELFRTPAYGQIFHPEIRAGHVLIAYLLRKRIQLRRDAFPDYYRRSWQLTALMAVFVAGQVLRSFPDGSEALESPDTALTDVNELYAIFDRAVDLTARVMHEYHASRESDFGFDDFKVDFKRENTAHTLARLATARRGTTNA